MNLHNMEDQYRRGINRPNANTLTLSLGPLVAQRSLLFRIQSDLVYKSTYGELTPAEESAFFAMTPSARILSSAINGKTPMSSASMYSQDSWRPPFSGILKTPFIPVPQDTRRRAMVFSPSLQWPDLRSAKHTGPLSALAESTVPEPMPYIGSPVPQRLPEDFTAMSPLQSVTFSAAFVVNSGMVIPSIEVSRASTALSPTEASPAPIMTIYTPQLAMEVHAQQEVMSTPTLNPAQVSQRNSMLMDDGKKLKKKKHAEDAPKRSAKHTTTFGRVMAHLSLQPSKKDIDQRRKTAMPTMPVISNPLPLVSRSESGRPSSVASNASVSTTASVPILASLLPQASLAIPSLELPSVRFSPIRTSFIANSMLSPDAGVKPFAFLSEPMVASMSEAATRARQARASQGPPRRRTMPPAALNLSGPIMLAPPTNGLGHRRFKSSPAALNFWKNGEEEIPPVPKLPALLAGSTLKVPV